MKRMTPVGRIARDLRETEAENPVSDFVMSFMISHGGKVWIVAALAALLGLGALALFS